MEGGPGAAAVSAGCDIDCGGTSCDIVNFTLRGAVSTNSVRDERTPVCLRAVRRLRGFTANSEYALRVTRPASFTGLATMNDHQDSLRHVGSPCHGTAVWSRRTHSSRALIGGCHGGLRVDLSWPILSAPYRSYASRPLASLVGSSDTRGCACCASAFTSRVACVVEIRQKPRRKAVICVTMLSARGGKSGMRDGLEGEWRVAGHCCIKLPGAVLNTVQGGSHPPRAPANESYATGANCWTYRTAGMAAWHQQ